MVGSEIDNPELIKLCEEAGALVVADRFCFGSLPEEARLFLMTRKMYLCRYADSICTGANVHVI